MSKAGMKQRLVKGVLGGWVYGTTHYRKARYDKRGNLIAMVCVKVPREAIEKYVEQEKMAAIDAAKGGA